MKINLAAFATLLLAGFTCLPADTHAQTEASDANHFEFRYSAEDTQEEGRKVEDFRIGAVLNRLDGDDDTVVRVRQVLPDSPAAKAGLKAEDIVLQYGEAKIDSYESMMAAIKKYGDKQTNVRIKRDDEQLTLPIKATVAAGETAMELRLDGPQGDDRSDQKNKNQQKDVAKDKAIDVAKKIIATKIIGKDGVVMQDFDDGEKLQLRWIQKDGNGGKAQVIVLSPEQDLENGRIRIALDELSKLSDKVEKAENVELKANKLRLLKLQAAEKKAMAVAKADSQKIDKDLFRALRVRLGKMDEQWSVFSSEFEALQRRVRRLEEAFKQSHSNSEKHEANIALARMERERHEAEMRERREQEMREAEMRERHEMELRERREAEMREREMHEREMHEREMHEREMHERERNRQRENLQSQQLINRVEQQEQRINQLQQQLRRLKAEMDQFRQQVEEHNRNLPLNLRRSNNPRQDVRRPSPTPGRPPVVSDRANDRGVDRDQPGVVNPYSRRARQSDQSQKTRPQQTRPNQVRPQQDKSQRPDRPARTDAEQSDAAKAKMKDVAKEDRKSSDRKPVDRKDSEILRSFQQQRIQMQRRSRRRTGAETDSDRKPAAESSRSNKERAAQADKKELKEKPQQKRPQNAAKSANKTAQSLTDLAAEKMERAKKRMEAARAAQAKALQKQKEMIARNKEMMKQQIEKAKASALEARKRVEAQTQAVREKAAQEKAAAELKQQPEKKQVSKDDKDDKKVEGKKKNDKKKDAKKKPKKGEAKGKNKASKKSKDKSKDGSKDKPAKGKAKANAEKQDNVSIPVKPIRPDAPAK